MKKNKKNTEGLESRRDFFKHAAKAALPILGAIVLAGAPQVLDAAEKTPSNCRYGCSTACSSSCTSTCYNTCIGSCRGTCRDACASMCNGCHHSCTGSCSSISRY